MFGPERSPKPRDLQSVVDATAAFRRENRGHLANTGELSTEPSTSPPLALMQRGMISPGSAAPEPASKGKRRPVVKGKTYSSCLLPAGPCPRARRHLFGFDPPGPSVPGEARTGATALQQKVQAGSCAQHRIPRRSPGRQRPPELPGPSAPVVLEKADDAPGIHRPGRPGGVVSCWRRARPVAQQGRADPR